MELPARWQRALDRRRSTLGSLAADDCLRLLHDEDEDLRGDRYGQVGWYYWYPDRPPAAADLERIAAFTHAAGAAHWHVHGMTDRGRDPNAARHWRSANAPESWTASEDGLVYELRANRGQSPGLFLDQRRNRAWVREQAAGARVLNLFAYTGAFGLAALAGGATEVSQVDLSASYLEWARVNAERNGADATRCEYLAVEARRLLTGCIKRGRQFDGVVCDPPSFARGRRRGEAVFRVQHDLPGLVGDCAAVVAPGGWVLVSSNYEGWRQAELERLVATAGVGRVAAAPGPGGDFGPATSGPRLNSAVLRVG